MSLLSLLVSYHFSNNYDYIDEQRNSFTPVISIRNSCCNDLNNEKYFTPQLANLNPLTVLSATKITKDLPVSMSSFITKNFNASGVKYSDLKFINSAFEAKTVYKHTKYCEWLDYNNSISFFESTRIFDPTYKVKRRRKDSEFASRQWSKNNGLSSLSLSKSNAYDSAKPEPVIEHQTDFYNKIFETEDDDIDKNKRLEFDFDEDYDSMSIPFECSMPHKDLKKMLKSSLQNDIYDMSVYNRTASKKSINL